MIKQAELNQDFFTRYGKLSRAKLFGRHGEPSRAELFFTKAQAETSFGSDPALFAGMRLPIMQITKFWIIFKYVVSTVSKQVHMEPECFSKKCAHNASEY